MPAHRIGAALDISNLFFTHHHFDHDADYAFFLLTRFDQSIGKEKELNVYGPPPTQELTNKLKASLR